MAQDLRTDKSNSKSVDYRDYTQAYRNLNDNIDRIRDLFSRCAQSRDNILLLITEINACLPIYRHYFRMDNEKYKKIKKSFESLFKEFRHVKKPYTEKEILENSKKFDKAYWYLHNIYDYMCRELINSK